MSQPLSPIVALAGAVLAVPLLPAQASVLPSLFGGLVVFGDSISDGGDSARSSGTAVTDDPSNTLAATGSLGAPFPSPPYFNGRFSDGPVFSDLLIAEFEAAGKPGLNFSFGGARAVQDISPPPLDIPDFQDQRLAFQALPQPPAEDLLAIVLFGGNDLFSALNASAGDPTVATDLARDAADEIGAQILAFGPDEIDTFAILNLADIGRAPRFAAETIETALGPVPNPLFPLQGIASLATQAFNEQLGIVAEELREAGRAIIEVDSGGGLQDILDNPTDFGFADDITSCGTFVGADDLGLFRYDFGQDDGFGNASGVSPTGCITEPFADLAGLPSNVESFLWWDDVHFTSGASEELARLIRSTVAATPVPVPAPVLLLAGGCLALVGLRRRAA